MRMQNVDMEFVTFDAQDVIATSPAPTSLAAQINLIRDYNTGRLDSDKLYNRTGGLNGGLDPAQEQSSKGGYWLYYDGNQSDTQPVLDGDDVWSVLRAAEDSAKESQPSADVVATSVADIVSWLSYNRMFQ